MKLPLVIALPLLLLGSAFAHIQVAGKMVATPKVGDNVFELRLKDHEGAPLPGAKISLVVNMSEMDMGKTTPAVTDHKDGRYTANVKFSMKGKWRIAATIASAGEETVTKNFDFNVGVQTTGDPIADPHAGHDMPPNQKPDPHQGHAMPPGQKPDPHQGHEMHGAGMKARLGDWSMSREGSGTSWLPDSSPMFMKNLGEVGGFDYHLMGTASLNYTDAGGKRGDEQVFSNSMAMLMGRKESGKGVWGFSIMGSLDPLFNGKMGYPDLFQTGETAYGEPLKDRQHPHDVLAELAVSYSQPIGKDVRAFIYGGPVGEPALGGPMFMHRPSGMENPEAPISHHWFDSSHITFGVVTLGASFGDKWQIEGSWFNGREPDENRYDIDQIRLNSVSARVSHNPTRDLALQVSYGYLEGPEPDEPEENVHRLTASAIHSREMANGDHLATTFFFGRNITEHGSTNAFGLEGTYFRGLTSYFARYERVEKDELVNVPEGTYTINKLIFGATRDVYSRGGYDVGIGGFAGLYAFPDSLEAFYGKNPVSFGLFLRVRPSRMKI